MFEDILEKISIILLIMSGFMDVCILASAVICFVYGLLQKVGVI